MTAPVTGPVTAAERPAAGSAGRSRFRFDLIRNDRAQGAIRGASPPNANGRPETRAAEPVQARIQINRRSPILGRRRLSHLVFNCVAQQLGGSNDASRNEGEQKCVLDRGNATLIVPESC